MLTVDAPVAVSIVPLELLLRSVDHAARGEAVHEDRRSEVAGRRRRRQAPGAKHSASLRALDRRVVDAVLRQSLRPDGAVRPAGAEASRQRGAVGAVEDGGGILRNLRRRYRRGAAADVEAAEPEVGDLVVPTVSESSSPENGGSGVDVVGSPVTEIVQLDVPTAVVNERCWPSGGGEVVVVVLVVVVVVVVVGTVTARVSAMPKASISPSIGASCVGVPHALSEPLKDDAALSPQVLSTCTPDFAAFEKQLVNFCAFLPMAVSFFAKH